MICNQAQNITGSVNGQVLTIAQPVIAADSVDYLTARFSFSEDWTGADKFAFFAKAGHEDEPAEILLIDDEITADAHLNLPAGRWNVWLVGLRTEGTEVTQRITTTVAEIRVQLSGVRNAEPFPGEAGSAGEQIVAQAIAARNAAQTAAQNAGTSANSAAEAAVSAAMSEDNAQESAENAEESAQTAAAAAGTATAAASSASASASAAAGSAAAAEQSANAAAGSATTAGQSATAAQNAQTAAEAARTAAAGSAAAAATSAREAEEAAALVGDLPDRVQNLEFRVADLRNIVYDTVVDDAAYTFADVDIAPIPTHISDGANFHKVFEGAELMLTEVRGKTAVVNNALVSSTVGGVKINGFNQIDAATVLPAIGFTTQPDGSFYVERPSTVYLQRIWTNRGGYTGRVAVQLDYKFNEGATAVGCRFRIAYTDGTYTTAAMSVETIYTHYYLMSQSGKQVDYIECVYANNNSSTWWKNVSINYSIPALDGTYKPYTSWAYSLTSPVMLLSALNAADAIRIVQQSNGTWNIEKVQNIAAADLGTRNWVYVPARQHFYASGWNAYPVGSTTVVANLLAAGYTTVATTYVYNNAPDYNLCIGMSSAGTQLYMSNQAYTDAAALRAALSGVILNYELATPIITTIAEGLTEDKIATLIELGGSIEIIGNASAENARPTINTIIQVEKAVEA